MGEGSLCNLPTDKSSFFIFSSHQNNCSLVILAILRTLDITLTSMRLKNSSTPSCVAGHDLFFQPFILLRSSFSFISFCSFKRLAHMTILIITNKKKTKKGCKKIKLIELKNNYFYESISKSQLTNHHSDSFQTKSIRQWH